MSEVTDPIFQCSEPVSGRIPRGTDVEAWSEREKIRGEYLPRIAALAGSARTELICEFAARVYDSWAARRFDLLASSKDLDAFVSEKETYYLLIVQPTIRGIDLTEEEEDSVLLTVAGRDSHWMTQALGLIFGFEENGPPGQGLSSNRRQSVIEHRTALLRKYKEKCTKIGIKATDSSIAIAASPSWHDRTPVMRWKRNDPRSTPAEDAKILAVLNKEPVLN